MIVVFGALNIDVMMSVKEFPQFGETVLCDSDYATRSGGKGANQAVAAARADAKVAMIGKVGDDSFGRRAVRNLKQQSVLTAGIGMSDRPTGCSTISVDENGHNMVITAAGANLSTTSDQVPDEILNEGNILLASLELDHNETYSVLKRAKEHGCVTVLNASPSKKIKKDLLNHVDYMIINEVEALQIANLFDMNDKTPTAIARELAHRFDLTCIVTLEAEGAIACRDGVLYTIPPLDIKDELEDSTGAGDCFCGVFAACLQKNMPWIESLHYASAAAGLSCTGFGAQESMPTFDDIVERLHEVKPPEKIDL